VRRRRASIAMLALHAPVVGIALFHAPTASAQAQHPVASDHRARAMTLIQSSQPPSASEDNQWRFASRAAAECQGMLGLFDLNSEILQSLPPDQRGPASWLIAFAARDKECTTEVEAEVKRCLEQIGRTNLASQLDALCDHPRLVPSLGPELLMQQNFGELGDFRMLGRLCDAQRRHAADLADAAEYARAFEHHLVLGRVAAATPLLIGRIVASAIQILACDHVITEITNGSAPPAALDALRTALRRHALPPMTLAVELERCAGLEMIEHFYDSVNAGVGQELPPAVAAVIGAAIGSREASIKLYNRAMDASRDALAADAATRERAIAERSEIDAIIEDPDHPEYSTVVGIVLPSLNAILRTEQKHRCAADGLAVVLAIECYRHDHNRLPENLDELTPNWLSAVPRDPFAPESPLRYKRVDPATDPLNRYYIVYSVGADGTDNAGKQAELNINATSTGPHGDGFDFIINAAR
jgi:hypothetical protein